MTETTTTENAPASPEPSRRHPWTLAIDIGGTGLKASVLDADGQMLSERVKIPTTYPLPPEGMIDALRRLVEPLPDADRISVGFPGLVREGRVLTAPHFITTRGPGSPIDPALQSAWRSFDLSGGLEAALGRPTRIANDADIQALAVIEGTGLELTITLGTGFGTGLTYEGQLTPHLELAHAPFRKGETYNEQLGERARKKIGTKKWNKRVQAAIDSMRSLMDFDHLYIGGGNSRRVDPSMLGDDITIVSNAAGILGGIKLWSPSHVGVEHHSARTEGA